MWITAPFNAEQCSKFGSTPLTMMKVTIMTSMKAVLIHAFGGPDVLRYEDVAMPAIGPDEVLVRVSAIGINPPDWYLRDGYRALPPEWHPKVDFPIILGTDISGTVEGVGHNVTGFSVGDEVYSMVRFFSVAESRAYAEYVAVPATELALKPQGIDHIHAAAGTDVTFDGLAVPCRCRA